MPAARKRIIAFVPIPLVPSSANGFAPRWLNFLKAAGEAHELEIVFVRGLWNWNETAEGLLPENFPANRVSVIDCKVNKEDRRAGLLQGILQRLRLLGRRDPAFIPTCELEFPAPGQRPPDLLVCFLFHTVQFARMFPSSTKVLYVLEEWPGSIPYQRPTHLIGRPNGIWRFLFWAGQRSKMIRLFRECASTGKVLLISEAEAQRIRRFIPAENLGVISHGVDCEYFRPAATGTELSEEFDIAIVGVMSEPRNYVPALKFYDAVSRIAGPLRLRWAFIGKDPCQALRRLQSDTVFVSGTVPDVRPYYSRSKVIAVPVESHAGVKSAILLGWAMQRPVVTTRQGVEGIVLPLDGRLVIAESLDDLAGKTIQLLLDQPEQRRLAEAGLRYARDQLDYRRLSKNFLALCDHLMGSPWTFKSEAGSPR